MHKALFLAFFFPGLTLVGRNVCAATISCPSVAEQKLFSADVFQGLPEEDNTMSEAGDNGHYTLPRIVPAAGQSAADQHYYLKCVYVPSSAKWRTRTVDGIMTTGFGGPYSVRSFVLASGVTSCNLKELLNHTETIACQ
jgi:hypothetical protein